MATGRIRRTARRGAVALVLGWLAVMVGSVLIAPSASADPQVTVYVRDLTPPLASVDRNGTVTFVNQIQDKPVQVGGAGGLLPSLVNVTVHTDVTLRLPSGTKQLPAGASVSEKFAQSCVTCSITFAYRMDSGSSLTSAVTDAVTKLLPPLPLPTPFVVNTLVQLPNLPGVNLPQLPQVNVPGSTGTPPTEDPTVDEQPRPEDPAPVPADPAQQPTVGGSTYSYGVPTGAAQLAPTGDAGSAFDAARFRVPGSGALGTASGSGGVAGGYDGANVPTFGQLAGLGNRLDESEDVAVASDAADLTEPQLSVPALLAVIALAGTSSALLRARRAQRASR
jgi:hypothetical protein